MPEDLLELGNLVGGKITAGRDWSVRENPARVSETVGQVAVGDAATASAAVESAHRAWASWRAEGLARRSVALIASLDAAVADLDDLPVVLARELGKVLDDCRGELTFARAWLQFCAERAPQAVADVEHDDSQGRLLMMKEPYGVVSAITPWNAPVILAFLKVAPALVTGNTMVVKPSPLAPLAVTALLTAVAQRLPDGVLNVVNGGADVGGVLTSHPLVRKVAFTGGLPTARHIARSAAGTVKPVVLELGGNDAAIFLPDADLSPELLHAAVFGSFLTSGQVCMAAKRLYVPKSRAREFVESYRVAADACLRLGNPLDEGTTVGPVVSRGQQLWVTELVDEAVAAGAEAVELGSVSDAVDQATGYWVRPTLVIGAGDDDRVVREEQFGPTVPLLTYEDEDEVVARAGAGELALGSSVWSRSEDEAFRVARRLDTGFTFVNCHNRMGLSLRAPFGGYRQSGHGREFGVEGLGEYVQTHAVHAPAATRSGAAGAARHYPEARS